MLRGSATASSPIIAGYVLMVAIGCLLALWRPNMPRKLGGATLAILGAGLIATLSRGPWVGTAFLVLVYLATGPNAAANLGRFAIVGVMALVVLPLTSFGARILDFLPFIGTVEHETLEYRKSLFEVSWRVIEQNLWFGSTDYRQAPEMQELMQGAGMIDIVNHYVKIALDAGVAGLILFLGFFGSILIDLRRVLKFGRPLDSDLRIYVRATMAILVAILVTIATASSIEYIPIIYMTFGGLGVALIRIAHRERAVAARAGRVRQVAV
jgi:O-antigen ligase